VKLSPLHLWVAILVLSLNRLRITVVPHHITLVFGESSLAIHESLVVAPEPVHPVAVCFGVRVGESVRPAAVAAFVDSESFGQALDEEVLAVFHGPWRPRAEGRRSLAVLVLCDLCTDLIVFALLSAACDGQRNVVLPDVGQRVAACTVVAEECVSVLHLAVVSWAQSPVGQGHVLTALKLGHGELPAIVAAFGLFRLRVPALGLHVSAYSEISDTIR
jgi:hypothetical protein